LNLLEFFYPLSLTFILVLTFTLILAPTGKGILRGAGKAGIVERAGIRKNGIKADRKWVGGGT
jgi:hypothetical protein